MNQEFKQNIISRVVRNAFWMFNGSVIVRFFNFVKGIVLARLLLPDDFGLFGLATVIIGFTQVFGDIGAGASLIYKQKDKDEMFANTAFWINIIFATLLSLVVVIVSPFMSSLYKRADLMPILMVLALVLWLRTGSVVHKNWLRKHLKFKSISIVEAVVSLSTFLVAIYLAFKGYGVWSFVVSSLFEELINWVLMIYVSGWIPKFQFSKEVFKILQPFSGFYISQTIFWYLVFSLPHLLIGKYLGMTELGFYSIANNYALLAVTLIANPLGNVIFPELVKLHDDMDKFWDEYYRISKLIIGSVVPIAIAMIVSAPHLFPFLLGSKWDNSILPFQIIVLYGIVRCIWADPFSALGKFDLSMYTAFITLILYFLGLLIGLKSDIVGVAISTLIVLGFSHILALYIVSKSLKKLFIGFQNAFPFLLIGLFAGLVSYFLKNMVSTYCINEHGFLAVFSIVVVFLLYGLFYRKHIMEVGRSLVNTRGTKVVG